MPTLNELANRTKHEIRLGDNNRANAEIHFGKAGRALTKAKKKVGHGGWLNWLRNNVQIGERRAQELMEIGSKKKTVVQMRKRVNSAVKKTNQKRVNNADLNQDACDYDWSNVQEADFGNPSQAYRAQAEHYRREATHLAEAYPLLSRKVDVEIITDKEIQAVRKVAQAWSELAESLAQRKQKEVLCA